MIRISNRRRRLSRTSRPAARTTPSRPRSSSSRAFLTVCEASFLLQQPEMVTRRMLVSGRLRTLGDTLTADGRRRRYVDVESVEELFPPDGSRRLRQHLMGAILAGRFVVPRPATRWAQPVSLSVGAEALHA